jgi:hypothetical protein
MIRRSAAAMPATPTPHSRVTCGAVGSIAANFGQVSLTIVAAGVSTITEHSPPSSREEFEHGGSVRSGSACSAMIAFMRLRSETTGGKASVRGADHLEAAQVVAHEEGAGEGSHLAHVGLRQVDPEEGPWRARVVARRRRLGAGPRAAGRREEEGEGRPAGEDHGALAQRGVATSILTPERRVSGGVAVHRLGGHHGRPPPLEANRVARRPGSLHLGRPVQRLGRRRQDAAGVERGCRRSGH